MIEVFHVNLDNRNDISRGNPPGTPLVWCWWDIKWTAKVWGIQTFGQVGIAVLQSLEIGNCARALGEGNRGDRSKEGRCITLLQQPWNNSAFHCVKVVSDNYLAANEWWFGEATQRKSVWIQEEQVLHWPDLFTPFHYSWLPWVQPAIIC